jgi:hypothetical protein
MALVTCRQQFHAVSIDPHVDSSDAFPRTTEEPIRFTLCRITDAQAIFAHRKISDGWPTISLSHENCFWIIPNGKAVL